MADLISRQAAIDAFTCDGSFFVYGADVCKAIVSRLKQLPSAQPEPCEDAVSRRRLLSDLKELIAAWEKYPVMAEQIKGVEVAIEYVKLIPSVQTEQKRQERQRVAQNIRYTFGNDEFSLEAAYHDCKLVFDGITDDDSFQEADTGLILYYANEIIYALQEALPSGRKKTGKWIPQMYGQYECSKCGFYETDRPFSYCPHCGAKMEDDG